MFKIRFEKLAVKMGAPLASGGGWVVWGPSPLCDLALEDSTARRGGGELSSVCRGVLDGLGASCALGPDGHVLVKGRVLRVAWMDY